MYVSSLTLVNFRSWPQLEVQLDAGVTAFIGPNGQGKTNIVEAIDYLSSLSSHRVASDAPLVRQGASQAVVQAEVVRAGRSATLEVEINPGKSNRGRINRADYTRARDLLGLVKTVVFAPDDLALVKGDPARRRHFLDQLMIQLTPAYAGTKADYDRVIRQRNSLLKNLSHGRRSGEDIELSLHTLAVWNDQLIHLGTEITARRAELIAQMAPLVQAAYESVAASDGTKLAQLTYAPSITPLTPPDQAPPDQAPQTRAPLPQSAADPDLSSTEPGSQPARPAEPNLAGENTAPQLSPAAQLRAQIQADFLAQLEARKSEELDRGVTLVGPHRDELTLELGGFPVRGYASHGESWSFALALRLAAWQVLCSDDFGVGDDPILILDDVFAELDPQRRDRLAVLISQAEQVLVTAAVPDDVPSSLAARRLRVHNGQVSPDD